MITEIFYAPNYGSFFKFFPFGQRSLKKVTRYFSDLVNISHKIVDNSCFCFSFDNKFV